MQDIWPVILAYVPLKKRYSYATVCFAWGKEGGYIDTSVTGIKEERQGKHEFDKVLSRQVKLRDYCGSLSSAEDLALLERHSPTLRKVRFYAQGTCRMPVWYEVTGRRNDTLKSLTSLTGLQIDEGLVDDVLRMLPRLKFFRLSGSCQVTDEGLSCLHNLETFVLDGNIKIKGTTLGSLTSLRNLALLGQTSIHGDVLGQLTNIMSLCVRQSKYTEEHLSRLTKLHALSFVLNPASKSLTQSVISYFPHLTRLEYVNAGEVEPHSTLRNLKDFYCNTKSVLCDTTLSQMTNLEVLRIGEESGVSGSSLALLSRLTRLEFLSEKNRRGKETVDLLPLSLRVLHLGLVPHFSALDSLSSRLTKLTNFSVKTGYVQGFGMESFYCHVLTSLDDLVLVAKQKKEKSLLTLHKEIRT